MPLPSELTNVDVSGYTRALPQPPAAFDTENSLLPRRSPILRASAIYIPGTFPSSDSLTGYHIGGVIPQYRSPLPPPASAQGASSTASATVISSSSSSTTTNNPAKSQTTSITTPVINPGNEFTGVLTMAKAFVVLTVTVNAAARVRLYSTASSRNVDLIRPITQGPGYGTEQGIIGDIVLDTTPVVWQAVNMVGANGDSPQTTNVYLTVDNIGLASTAITATILYVPVQS